MPVENPKSKKDDTAFGIGADGVMPMGALVDETNADSADEGDVGIPRMTANRILRTVPTAAGGGEAIKTDDAAFTVGTDAVTPMGAMADETNPDSVNEGDVGIPRMTLDRQLRVIAGANSGVDIGDVDVLSIAAGDNNIGNVDIASIAAGDNNIGNMDIVTLPAGNLGQQAMAASLSTVPANNITDATYIGDIKFGEALPAGSAIVGQVGIDQTTPGTTNLVLIGSTYQNSSLDGINAGRTVELKGVDDGIAAGVLRVYGYLVNPSGNADRPYSIAASGAGLGVQKVASPGQALTLLASAARTAETNSSDQGPTVAFNKRGLIIFVNVSSITDTPVLTPVLQIKDSISGNYKTVWTAAATITATGQYAYLFAIGGIGGAGSFTEAIPIMVGETWRFQMTVADTDSATYSVSCDVLV